MPKSLSLAYDLIASVPVFAVDPVGNPLPLPADATVASDDPSVAVAFSTDRTAVLYSATKRSGSANVTLSPGPSTPSATPDVVAVAITVPQASGLVQDVAHATFAANPSPPTS